ncbi:MAG TPA: NAD-dependent epimerase/dehydratase family protein [Ramlibacter sp.]|jgi:nucleoside-diphosphate-sugar epimerase|uniref:NAD-dependent epimerase/dehydratase family protein n=1 Tax=Ramlibacter sp. TaxID=1917967 RepID=UPI002D261A0F|nr:NAD-dependent epimerase/dehydratase family protein [Ramlibacter sp.]HZY20333.1 NAD-dependent epimerase/dehydratase family protein [Ramlibacter sp.]
MAALEGCRIAVTGAGGFVGRALVSHLANRGAEVLAISRQGEVAGACSVVPWPASAQAQARLLAGSDAVVHLAAVAHAAAQGTAGQDLATFAPNLALTRQVAMACGAAGVPRLVLTSSIGVHGVRTHGRPFTEDDPPAPVEPYAASKLACERAAAELTAQHQVGLVVVRPPLVYGPRAPGNFGALWRAVARGRVLPLGSIDNRRSLVGVGNLAHLLALCAVHAQAPGQAFLAADGEDVSTPELVRRIARAQGRPVRVPALPLALLRLAGTLAGRRGAVERLGWSLQVDAGKARRLLGWQPPYGLDEGLARAARAEASA